jgi:hypothetical protein
LSEIYWMSLNRIAQLDLARSSASQGRRPRGGRRRGRAGPAGRRPRGPDHDPDDCYEAWPMARVAAPCLSPPSLPLAQRDTVGSGMVAAAVLGRCPRRRCCSGGAAALWALTIMGRRRGAVTAMAASARRHHATDVAAVTAANTTLEHDVPNSGSTARDRASSNPLPSTSGWSRQADNAQPRAPPRGTDAAPDKRSRGAQI